MIDAYERRDTFNRAADLVEQGWVRGSAQFKDPITEKMSYCAVGSVIAACPGLNFFPDGSLSPEGYPEWEARLSAIFPVDDRERFVVFNDGKARNGKEVAEKLRLYGAGKDPWQ